VPLTLHPASDRESCMTALYALTQEDPRITPVMAMSSQCDRCSRKGDDAQFLTVGTRIAALMNTPTPLQSVPPHVSPAH
jgi:hypothetical protein